MSVGHSGLEPVCVGVGVGVHTGCSCKCKNLLLQLLFKHHAVTVISHM